MVDIQSLLLEKVSQLKHNNRYLLIVADAQKSQKLATPPHTAQRASLPVLLRPPLLQVQLQLKLPAHLLVLALLLWLACAPVLPHRSVLVWVQLVARAQALQLLTAVALACAVPRLPLLAEAL